MLIQSQPSSVPSILRHVLNKADFLNLQLPAKCWITDKAPHLNEENVIMCRLVTAITSQGAATDE
jgi:hypothetical protein